jgi:hypothetical protein
MKSRNEVVAMVRAKIRLLHLALSTEDSYCGWVARYYDFCRGCRLASRTRERRRLS